jgi:hypothetical protein
MTPTPDERAHHDGEDAPEAMPTPVWRFAGDQTRVQLSVVTFLVAPSGDSQDRGLDSCLVALQRVVAMLAQTKRRVLASQQAIKRSELALEQSYLQLGRVHPPIPQTAHRPRQSLT